MASGFAPKDPGVRRNRVKPARGEWIDLPVATHPVPALPKRAAGTGRWSALTKSAWTSWWSDPASTQWSEADVGSLEAVVFLMEDFYRGEYKVAAEIRLRTDGLGLTQKGKRDLRWRIVAAAPAVPDGTVTALDDYRDLVG